MANLYGAGIGGFLGGASQTGDDSYFSTMLGIGTGAAIGATLDYAALSNINLVKEKKSGVKTFDVSSRDFSMSDPDSWLKRMSDMASGARHQAADYLSMGRSGDMAISRAGSITTSFLEEFGDNLIGSGLMSRDKYDNYIDILSNYSDSHHALGMDEEIFGSIRKYVASSGESSETILNRIASADPTTSMSMTSVGNYSVISGGSTRSVSSNMPIKDYIASIKDILIQEYNNPSDVAERKAAIIGNSTYGSSVEFSGSEMKVDGSSINITSYGSDGSRFTTRGSTKFSTKSFNPYARAYTDGISYQNSNVPGFESSKVPTISDALTAYDPEEMLGFRGDRTISEVSDMVLKYSGYIGEDSRINKSNSSYVSFIKNNSIDVGLTLSPKGSLYEINQVGKGRDQVSELNRFINKVAKETGRSPYSQISHNTLTEIWNPSQGDLWHPAAFKTEEAGASRVNIRATGTSANANKSVALQKLAESGNTGAEALLYHSNQGTRVDLSSGSSKLLSHLFGDNVVPDDGLSLVTEDAIDNYKSYEEFSIKVKNIGTIDNPIAMLSDEFSSGVIGSKISPGTDLGFDTNGLPVSLGKQFTSGVIDDAIVGADEIILKGTGEYSPKRGDVVKHFGVSNKPNSLVVNKSVMDNAIGLSILERMDNVEVGKDFISVDGNRVVDQMEIRKLLETTYRNEFDRLKGLGNYAHFSSIATEISRYEDVGLSLLDDIVSGNKESVDEFIDTLSNESKNAFKKQISNLKDSSSNKSSKMNSARTILALSDTKSNSDIWMTLYESEAVRRGGNLSKLEDLKAFITSDQFIKDTSSKESASAIKSLQRMMDHAYRGQVFTMTTFTPDLSDSIAGIGNRASASWLVQNTMKMNGFTDYELSKIMKSNPLKVNEMAMLMSHSDKGSLDISGQEGNKYRLPSVLEMNTSERADTLKSLGYKFNDKKFVNYSLSKEIDGVRSLPISFQDNSYSGASDIGDIRVVKRLDRLRSDIIAKDIALRDTMNPDAAKYAEADLRKSVSAYISEYDKIMSNLSKDASKKELVDSKIMSASFVSGEAEKFASDFHNNTGRRNIAFVSRDQAREMFPKSSIETGKSSIKRISSADGNTALALLHREPAQGPGSAIPFEIYVDDNMNDFGKSRNQVYFATDDNGTFLKRMMFGDADRDPIGFTPLDKYSSDELSSIRSKSNALATKLDSLFDMQKMMSPKSDKKISQTLLDMESSEHFSRYMSMAGQKGRHRKPIAPAATRANVDLSMSIGMNKSLSEDRAYAARTIAHNLTENLLKTKHKLTLDHGENPNGAAELFSAYQDKWFNSGKDGGSSMLRSELTSIIDDQIGGKIMALDDSDEIKMNYISARDDLVTSYERHGRYIFNNPTSQLDIASLAGKGFNEKRSGIERVLLNGASITSGNLEGTSAGTVSQMRYNASEAVKEIVSSSKSFLSDNKKLLATGAITLAAIASITGADKMERSAKSMPSPQKETLKPLNDTKAYVRKDNPQGKNVKIDARVEKSRLNQGLINDTLFSDSQKVNMNITDRSGLF